MGGLTDTAVSSVVERTTWKYDEVEKFRVPTSLPLTSSTRAPTCAVPECDQYGEYPSPVILRILPANVRSLMRVKRALN